MTWHHELVGDDLHIARSDQGTGSPVGVVTPGIVGQLYHDDATGNIWVADGLTDTDWILNSTGAVVDPATTVVAETSLDLSTVVGTSLDYAREDHSHGSPTSATIAAAADYAGRFEQATIGTGDIGTNRWGWWWNTTTSKLFHVRNRAGTLYAVELTQIT
jgi:hypothetical protein